MRSGMPRTAFEAYKKRPAYKTAHPKRKSAPKKKTYKRPTKAFSARRPRTHPEHSDYMTMTKNIFATDVPAFFPSNFTGSRVPQILESVWTPTVRSLSNGATLSGTTTLGGFCMLFRPDINNFIIESDDTFSSSSNGLVDSFQSPDYTSGLAISEHCDRYRSYCTGIEIMHIGTADSRSGTVTVCFPNGNQSVLPDSPSNWAQAGANSKILSFQHDIRAQANVFAQADFQNHSSANSHEHINSIAIYVQGVQSGSIMIKVRTAIEYIPKVGSITASAARPAVAGELSPGMQKRVFAHHSSMQTS